MPRSLTLSARRVGDPLTLFGSDRQKMRSESKERFESGEHVWIGDRGFELGLKDARDAARTPYRGSRFLHRQDKSEAFRYGEVVALSGDFYGTPDELYWETPTCIPWLWERNDLSDIRETFAREIEAVEEQQRGGVEYPDHNLIYVWNAKAYDELALGNTAHFGWHNLKAYCTHHRAALEFARQARQLRDIDPVKAEELWGLALFTNAFGDHFLTDAFAAGHIRVPRQEIRSWAEAQEGSEKLAGALSKLLHDQDGHLETLHGEGHSLVSNEAEGLRVLNTRGDTWHTRCDGQLFIGNSGDEPVIRFPVEAVRSSVKELFMAYLSDDPGLPAGLYEATTYVPFPHPEGPGLADKFSANTSDARIEKLFESTQWYLKIPYIGPGLEADHIKALFAALPGLLGAFRQGVKQDLDQQGELRQRLPQDLLDAFGSLM